MQNIWAKMVCVLVPLLGFIATSSASDVPATQPSAVLKGKWVCVGASITEGALASKPEFSYVNRLAGFARRDGCDLQLINEGRSGWSTGAYAYNAAKLAKRIPVDASIITIDLGTNDLREKKSPEEVGRNAAKNLETLIKAYQNAAPMARIIIITPAAVYPEKFTSQLRSTGYSDDAPAKLKAICDAIGELTHRLGLQKIDATLIPSKQDSVEGVHPNDDGHARLAELIWNEVIHGFETFPQRPALVFDNQSPQCDIGTAYGAALHNLLDINSVCPETGKELNPFQNPDQLPEKFVRAGGGYDKPWTRDASINSWFAASLLEPDAARNTLSVVCQKHDDGTITVQQDNQWWDQCIWVVAAWNHYLVTGDREFLQQSYPVAIQSLQILKKAHFNFKYGLYMGPAFFADGIAGYPPPEFDAKNNSSFVLSHPHTDKLMVLSTNCVYRQAYRSAAAMARALGKPSQDIDELDHQSQLVKEAINAHLWSDVRKEYAYFLSGAGPDEGQLFFATEGMGRSFALLFDVAEKQQQTETVQMMHAEPKGVVALWPNLPQFDDHHLGRHNVMLWPLVNGTWAVAAAKFGATDRFASELANMADLSISSGNNFYEIYNPRSGQPDGGWQNRGHWGPVGNQTWSATAYIAAIHYGLFGMRFDESGLTFSPTLPWTGPVELRQLPYRHAMLTIRLIGKGSHIDQFSLDGQAVSSHSIPATLAGAHQVEITLSELH